MSHTYTNKKIKLYDARHTVEVVFAARLARLLWRVLKMLLVFEMYVAKGVSERSVGCHGAILIEHIQSVYSTDYLLLGSHKLSSLLYTPPCRWQCRTEKSTVRKGLITNVAWYGLLYSAVPMVTCTNVYRCIVHNTLHYKYLSSRKSQAHVFQKSFHFVDCLTQ